MIALMAVRARRQRDSDQNQKLARTSSGRLASSEMSDSYFAARQSQSRRAICWMRSIARRRLLKAYVRLMEEDYGVRDWAKFETDPRRCERSFPPRRKIDDAESERFFMRRFETVIGRERASNPKSADEFKTARSGSIWPCIRTTDHARTDRRLVALNPAMR